MRGECDQPVPVAIVLLEKLPLIPMLARTVQAAWLEYYGEKMKAYHEALNLPAKVLVCIPPRRHPPLVQVSWDWSGPS